jgi:hypothetical protein
MMWAPEACTNAIACPRCGAEIGQRCATDRPLHVERWDAWRAVRFSPPPFLGPGWLLAYAVSGLLWVAILEFWPVALIIAFAAAGALGIVALGNLLSTGHTVPPEDRR